MKRHEMCCKIPLVHSFLLSGVQGCLAAIQPPPSFIQLTTHFDCFNGRAGQRARQYESQSENKRGREKERVMEKQLAGGDRRETVPENKWKTLFP